MQTFHTVFAETVLQSDAMLLSRRLDRQESSLRKVTDFRNSGEQLVSEQQKLISGKEIIHSPFCESSQHKIALYSGQRSRLSMSLLLGPLHIALHRP